jgi:hypothetical protein
MEVIAVSDAEKNADATKHKAISIKLPKSSL